MGATGLFNGLHPAKTAMISPWSIPSHSSVLMAALRWADTARRAWNSLILQGRSNQEVAAETFLSLNSVKTYIRSAYRKIGVHHRAQAAVWAMQHGFAPPAG
jgi:hypothetical protein